MTPENLIYTEQKQQVLKWIELAMKIAATMDNHSITPDDFEKALPFILATNFKDKDPSDPTIHLYFQMLEHATTTCLKLGKLAQRSLS